MMSERSKFCTGVLCLVFILLTSFDLNAQTTYYVSAFGNDNNSGLDPENSWKTLQKVNNQMETFQAGDQILFKCGEQFTGNLILTKDNITFASYGTGDRPVLSGGKSITQGWENFSGNIWKVALSEAPDKLTNLYKNNCRLPIGRFPNSDEEDSGFLTIESSSDANQFVDNELTSAIDWTGADVVVKVYEYRYSRATVSTHNGSSINLKNNLEVDFIRPGSGYYFVNSIQALDRDGEWSYNTATGTIYLFSNTDPNGFEYTFPDTDKVIEINNATNVTIKDLDVRFGKNENIGMTQADQAKLENINVSDGGGQGIHIEQTTGASISSSTFNLINVRALYIKNQTSDIVVQDNVFKNIGLDAAYGTGKGLYCIYNESDRIQYLRNRLDSIGGGGIVTGGKNQLIKQNYISNVLLIMDDMGGIYTNNNLGGLTTSGTVIEENIVENSLGNPAGSYHDRSWAIGIYLDNHSSNVTVRNNSVFNCGSVCYFLHLVTNKTVFTGNTALGAPFTEVYTYIYDDQSGNSANFEFNDNIIASRDTSDSHLNFHYNCTHLDFDQSGNYSGNYFIKPFQNENIKIRNFEGAANNAAHYDAHRFDSNRPNIQNSSPSPVNFSKENAEGKVMYYYNETQANKTITLPPGKYIDVQNNLYCGDLTLEPFKSVVLLKQSEKECSAEEIEVNTPQSFEATEISDLDCTFAWQAEEGAINYDLRYKLTSEDEWKYINNIQSATHKIEGLEIVKDYECQLRASGVGNESEWSASIAFTTLPEAKCKAPGNIIAGEIMASSAVLSWGSFRVAKSYNIRFRQSGQTEWNTVDSIPETDYQLYGLAFGKEYECQVQSNCQYGVSEWSETYRFSTTTSTFIQTIQTSDNNEWVMRDINTDVITFKEHASVILVGRSGDTNNGIAVYPFQLPVLAAGEEIMDANFQVVLDNDAGPVGSIFADLWALPYRSSDAVSYGDYYDGVFLGSNQANAVKIQTGFIDADKIENIRQTLSTSSEGAANLAFFIKQQYTNGAQGGEWIFLRVNTQQPTVSTRHWLDRAEDTDDGVPNLKLTISSQSNDMPTAVSNFTVVFDGESKNLLNWTDNSSNEEGFIIERKTEKSSFVGIDTAAVNSTGFEDDLNGIENGYLYYRLLSYNANGVTGYSNVAKVLVIKKPNAPENLSAAYANENQINLSWEDHSTSEEKFIIERKTKDSEFEVLVELEANTVGYTDDITPGTAYTYRIKAGNQGGDSDYSNESTPDIFVPIDFINATLQNIIPEDAISATSATGDNLWFYRTGITNGTMDGNYVESHMQSGDDSPNISIFVEDTLDADFVYKVYLYFISPASQDWQILAKLPSDAEYAAYGRNTEGVELLNDNDGTPDRLYRVYLGQVSGTADLQVNLSDDLPASVWRAAFDGIGIQKLGSNTTTGLEDVDKNPGKSLARFRVYPNPVEDYLNIILDGGDLTSFTFQITNLLGRVIYLTGEIYQGKAKINLQSLQNGVYFIRIPTDKRIVFSKFIKQ